MAFILRWSEASGAKSETVSSVNEALAKAMDLLAQSDNFAITITDDEGRKVEVSELMELASKPAPRKFYRGG